MRELPCWLIVFESVGLDCIEGNIATEISAEVAEMRCLLYNGTALLGLVPPVHFSDLRVCARVTHVDGHYCQIVDANNIHGCLYHLEVPQHVANGDPVPGLPEQLHHRQCLVR